MKPLAPIHGQEWHGNACRIDRRDERHVLPEVGTLRAGRVLASPGDNFPPLGLMKIHTYVSTNGCYRHDACDCTDRQSTPCPRQKTLHWSESRQVDARGVEDNIGRAPRSIEAGPLIRSRRRILQKGDMWCTGNSLQQVAGSYRTAAKSRA